MQKKKMSVGFADLSGYGKLPENLDPAKIVELLQDFYKFIGDIVLSHNGKIIKYIGDAVMFSFDDPKKAAAAVKKMADFEAEVDSFPLQACVSVATGEVVASKIGHPSKMVEDIFGGTVNRAARLQGEAARNTPKIAFDEKTKKLLK